VLELPEQVVAFPDIVPGWLGMLLTVMASVCAVDDPHVLLAVTETLPLIALAVAVMEAVVEVPVQPPGNVQV
jgi:hypothetical protein